MLGGSEILVIKLAPTNTQDHEFRFTSAETLAITANEVVAITYRDRNGAETRREVEPVGVLALDDDWYMVGWCRLRNDARSFGRTGPTDRNSVRIVLSRR